MSTALPEIYADLGALIDEVLDEWLWPVKTYDDMRPWLKQLREVSHRLEAESRRVQGGLRTIAGPASDGDPFIDVYREATGGYEGLQAIARALLDESGASG